ncbi:MAG: hypothetical protein FWB72_00740 [Firmicutes bacterium]|nr:hypothetical protein [Bacillota bacterium]
MRKVIARTLIVLLILVPLITLTACDNDYNNGENRPGSTPGDTGNITVGLSSNMFSGFRADLAGAESLAIVNQNNAARARSLQPTNSVLVGIDRDNNTFDIVFTRIITIECACEVEYYCICGTNRIMQLQIQGQITKLYITELFIFFSISLDVSLRVGIDYDQTNLFSTNRMQSFLIDRHNGNIYSLSAMRYIRHIEGNIVRASQTQFGTERYYFLQLEENEIHFTPIMPNPNVNVLGVFECESGYIFVITNSITERVGNFIYLDGQVSNTWFKLGDDGLIYRVTNNSVQVYCIDTHLWTAPNITRKVTMSARTALGGLHSRTAILSENYFVSLSVWSTWSNGYLLAEVYQFTTYYHQLAIFGGRFITSTPAFRLSSSRIFYVRDRDLYKITGIYFGTWGSLSHTTKRVVGNVNEAEFFNNHIIVTTETILGTLRYMIYFNEQGELTQRLYQQQIHEWDVIVIRPLNI